MVSLPLAERLANFKATIMRTFFHGLDDHLGFLFKLGDALRDQLASVVLRMILAAIIVLALIKMAGPERRRLVSLLLLWLMAVMPHVLAANWQYRYLYFPGVFAALVLAALLGFLGRRAGKAGYVLAALVVLGYFSMDVKAFRLAEASFAEASGIYDAGLSRIRERLPELPSEAELILIDFPDYIFSRQNQGPSGAGLSIMSMSTAMSCRPISGCSITCRSLKVTHLRLAAPSRENPAPLGKTISGEKAAALLAAPQTYAFRYLPGTPPHFIPWDGRPGED